MIHTFTFKDKYFVYDVESGSLLNCDKIIYDILSQNDISNYNQKDIIEAKTEIESLKEEGLLFSKTPKAYPILSNGEIKSLCVHICHDCNLKCTYCFGDGGTFHGRTEYMDLKTAIASVDFLLKKSGNRKNLEMDFFGGEPLLNLNTIKETVKYARAKEKTTGKLFKFTTTTNGVLLNDDAIEFLNKEMDNVVISIDGRKEVHDNIRKTVNDKASYDVIMKNAKKFRKIRKDKEYYIRGTFTSKNIDFSKDVLSINDNGFDQISIEPVVMPENNPLALKKCHLKEIMAEYDKLAEEYIERRKTDKWFNFFHFMIELDNGPCIKKRLTGCGAGDEYMAVAPSGILYPCHQFVGQKEYILGNVFDGVTNQEKRKQFTKSSLLSKQDCQNCFAKYFCSGGCSYNNIAYGGGIDNPYKMTCEMMRKRFELSLAIKAIENL